MKWRMHCTVLEKLAVLMRWSLRVRKDRHSQALKKAYKKIEWNRKWERVSDKGEEEAQLKHTK